MLWCRSEWVNLTTWVKADECVIGNHDAAISLDDARRRHSPCNFSNRFDILLVCRLLRVLICVRAETIVKYDSSDAIC